MKFTTVFYYNFFQYYIHSQGNYINTYDGLTINDSFLWGDNKNVTNILDNVIDFVMNLI